MDAYTTLKKQMSKKYEKYPFISKMVGSNIFWVIFAILVFEAITKDPMFFIVVGIFGILIQVTKQTPKK